MTPSIGSPAPSFKLATHDGTTVSLDSLRGRPVVLYFYPADDTPGCTTQACELRDEWPAFEQTGAVVLGVSPDTVESHRKFRAKYNLPFTLLADPDRRVANAYGVWGKKKTFGIPHVGIIRTTFIIDAEGVLRHVLPVRRVKGHAEKVMELLRAK